VRVLSVMRAVSRNEGIRVHVTPRFIIHMQISKLILLILNLIVVDLDACAGFDGGPSQNAGSHCVRVGIPASQHTPLGLSGKGDLLLFSLSCSFLNLIYFHCSGTFFSTAAQLLGPGRRIPCRQSNVLRQLCVPVERSRRISCPYASRVDSTSAAL